MRHKGNNSAAGKNTALVLPQMTTLRYHEDTRDSTQRTRSWKRLHDTESEHGRNRNTQESLDEPSERAGLEDAGQETKRPGARPHSAKVSCDLPEAKIMVSGVYKECGQVMQLVQNEFMNNCLALWGGK